LHGLKCAWKAILVVVAEKGLLQPNGEAATFMAAPARLVFPKSL